MKTWKWSFLIFKKGESKYLSSMLIIFPFENKNLTKNVNHANNLQKTSVFCNRLEFGFHYHFFSLILSQLNSFFFSIVRRKIADLSS